MAHLLYVPIHITQLASWTQSHKVGSPVLQHQVTQATIVNHFTRLYKKWKGSLLFCFHNSIHFIIFLKIDMTSMLGSTKEEVTCLKVVTINLNPYTRTVRIITTSMSKGKNLIIEAKVTDISLYKNFLYFTTLSSMGQKKVLISKLTSVNYDSTNRITSRPSTLFTWVKHRVTLLNPWTICNFSATPSDTFLPQGNHLYKQRNHALSMLCTPTAIN